MKLFSIGVFRNTYQCTEIEIEAENEEAAHKIAQDRRHEIGFQDGNVEFEYETFTEEEN